MERPEYELTRRGFFQVGGAAVVSLRVASLTAPNVGASAQLEEAIARLEYLTPLDRAFILDKGKAEVAKLPADKLREIGLAPDTWTLEVLPDPASNSIVGRPLTRERGTALTWNQLMELARTHAVLWEGVPVAGGDKILERVDSRGDAVHVAYFGA